VNPAGVQKLHRSTEIYVGRPEKQYEVIFLLGRDGKFALGENGIE
jgi:hypothetical protein